MDMYYTDGKVDSVSCILALRGQVQYSYPPIERSIIARLQAV